MNIQKTYCNTEYILKHFLCVYINFFHFILYAFNMPSRAIQTKSRLIKGVGMGKGASRRNSQQEGINYIPEYAIRKLARRGGVKRIGSSFIPQCKVFSEKLLEELVKYSIVYMEHARRRTLRPSDVKEAAKGMNMKLYS